MEETSMHVRRAIAGDLNSLNWTVRRLSPLLLAQSRYRLYESSPSLSRVYDAEDLVSATWLIALPRLVDLRPRDARYTPVLVKFLSTILLNQFRDIVRHHIAGKADVESLDLRSSAVSIAPEHAHAEIGVVDEVIRLEREGLIAREIAALDPEDRRILVLRGIEQHAVTDVAQLLGLRPNTLSVRYRRLLDRLRRTLPGTVLDELEDEGPRTTESGWPAEVPS